MTTRGNVAGFALVAGVIFSVISLFGFIMLPLGENELARMYIDPEKGIALPGEEFTVQILVTAATPVNVFAGELTFNNTVIEVVSIDYNTSIADLWTERPWFQNGDGTLNFSGGSTVQGGFIGSGTLIEATFRAIAEGDAMIRLEGARILKHDGLGTDIPLQEFVNAQYVVENAPIPMENLIANETASSDLKIVAERPRPDINGDGRVSIQDVSILMTDIVSGDVRSDLSGDGNVTIQDLSIMMGAL